MMMTMENGLSASVVTRDTILNGKVNYFYAGGYAAAPMSSRAAAAAAAAAGCGDERVYAYDNFDCISECLEEIELPQSHKSAATNRLSSVLFDNEAAADNGGGCEIEDQLDSRLENDQSEVEEEDDDDADEDEDENDVNEYENERADCGLSVEDEDHAVAATERRGDAEDDETDDEEDENGEKCFTSILVEDGFIRMSSPVVSDAVTATSAAAVNGDDLARDYEDEVASCLKMGEAAGSNFPNVGSSPLSEEFLNDESLSTDNDETQQPGSGSCSNFVEPQLLLSAALMGLDADQQQLMRLNVVDEEMMSVSKLQLLSNNSSSIVTDEYDGIIIHNSESSNNELVSLSDEDDIIVEGIIIIKARFRFNDFDSTRKKSSRTNSAFWSKR
jgi:hypothetical protein